jgi:tetraacyldisaccharide 4'-kinase
MWFIRLILFPVSCLYGIIVMVRNKLFDLRIIPSKHFNLPVIAIGNLCVGGTGKSPLIEYLVRLLKNHKVAVISRGYKRKSSGYLRAEPYHTVSDIGDEPLQFSRKFPELLVAVDERRRRGIELTLAHDPGIEIILLDDAYQHRYVRPGLSILLTDYHHLYTGDYPMPTGYLREFRSGARRADIIVVTKTPKIFSPIIRRELTKELAPRDNQHLFFSYIEYGPPRPLTVTGIPAPQGLKASYILMFTGIANAYPLQEYLSGFCNDLTVIDFGDHHAYTAQDMKKIFDAFDNIISKDKFIFTTEKDAMRIDGADYRTWLEGRPLFYIPIVIRFHTSEGPGFDKIILDYVGKHNKIR